MSQKRHAALCCQWCSKTKYEPTILVLKETTENCELSKEWSCARNIAAKLRYNYAIFRLKENSRRETNNFVISSFILVKRAVKWQLLTLLFRKSEDENKSQICDFSRYFSRKGRKKFSCKCDCIGHNFKLLI